MSDQAPNADDYSGIHDAIVTLLEDARHAASRSVNALMTATYWEVGRRIVESMPTPVMCLPQSRPSKTPLCWSS